jgi:outer membrane protein OmpA-like peptidoglycan-associated protein
MRWSYQARMQSSGKLAVLCLGLTSLFGWADTSAAGQTAPSNGSTLSRTTKAVTYRRTGGAVEIPIRGTELMPQANGLAKIENKGNRVEIEAKFQAMDDATRFGLEYLTYVLWAVSPQGRAVNLGEVQVKGGLAGVKAITDMQTFGLVVTAEPYFAVSQPGDEVVLENAANTGGENIEARYELLGRGIYSSSNTKIENAIFGVDRKAPVELFEARNSVRIAKNAGAGSYAVSTIAKADEQLQGADEAYRQKRDKKTVIALARDTVQTAEEARVISVKKKAEDDAQAQSAAEKKAADDRAMKARADAQAEAARRQQAELARQQAEAAKADAERMKAQAEQAAAEAGRARQDADRARQAALAEQQAAVQQRQAAEAEAEKARQAAARAEAEKAQMRAQLLAQLNSILQTNDTARGLIVNMSDVLFDTASHVLKPGAREKLAKISGILLAHPGLTMQIEGHTDSVGGDEFNQQLSEQRAGSVREFLAQQGVPVSSITARGLGKTQPVASNDTPEGRQRNRRVEIVVNGESIGAGVPNSARFANQD